MYIKTLKISKKGAGEVTAADIITDVKSNLEDGLPEVEIIFDRDLMYNLALNIYSVSSEIKANIDGVTATRYEDNGDEIDMIVSLSEKDKEKQITGMFINTLPLLFIFLTSSYLLFSSTHVKFIFTGF